MLLSYDFPPKPGGISRAMSEIARHSAPVMLVCTGRVAGDSDWDRGSSIPVMRVPVESERLRTIGGLVRWTRGADQLIRANQTEFIWAGNIKPAGHVARWLNRRRGVAYGLIAHGLDLGILSEQAGRSPRKRAAARSILGNAAVVVANSHWTADRCRRLFQELDLDPGSDKIRVVLLGADPQRFRPDGSRYSLGPGTWLLTVARLVPHKGIDTGIEALARLAPRFPGLGYAVAGEGPDFSRLIALAERLGVADRVRFLGPVDDGDLPALYRASTLYVGLSREEGREVEGFGLSLVEAQASGRAVVAARSGGIPDSVSEEAGLLVSPGDVAAAAGALALLLADPDRRTALGKSGRERVERELNWKRVVEDLRLAERAALRSGR